LRAQQLLSQLNKHKEEQWTLVLPPFYNPHWTDEQDIPWSRVFDLGSLRKEVLEVFYVYLLKVGFGHHRIQRISCNS